jgi:hypothetical protein
VDDRHEPQEYSPPVVVDYGDLNDLTGGNASGTQLDADFQAHTKSGDLTFS